MASEQDARQAFEEEMRLRLSAIERNLLLIAARLGIDLIEPAIAPDHD